MSTILIIGGGGREHALAWRCASEGHRVVASPGSDAIAAVADCVRTDGSIGATIQLAKRESVDLALIGPEAPLVAGLADALRFAGVPTIGPGQAAAELEGSKSAAKVFMRTHGIPSARSITVRAMAEARAALRSFERPPVVKASGLAAGKGVTVAETHAQAEAALRECLEAGRFGAAGREVVLEQRLDGQEASFFVLTDGTRMAHFLPCQDHKRIGEGDTGPNTGGMGAYAPAPVVDDAVRGRILDRVVAPTLAGLRREGRRFIGVLFVGLMIDADGQPAVIEYNVRFGDPEVQPLMLGLGVPLVPRLLAAAGVEGQLADEALPGRPAATVVMASAGYPTSSTKGVEIVGLDAAMAAAAGDPDLAVFHAGTRRDGAVWRTHGGRVLGICAAGDELRAALAKAYGLVDRIELEGGQVRRDIGARVS